MKNLLDRLRTYYPRLAESPHCSLMVHAKVMVIDDTFVRVGSSNLSNRAMGLDSECDLAIAAGTEEAAYASTGPVNILDGLARSTGTEVFAGPTLLEEKGQYGNALLTRIHPVGVRRHFSFYASFTRFIFFEYTVGPMVIIIGIRYSFKYYGCDYGFSYAVFIIFYLRRLSAAFFVRSPIRFDSGV